MSLCYKTQNKKEWRLIVILDWDSALKDFVLTFSYMYLEKYPNFFCDNGPNSTIKVC